MNECLFRHKNNVRRSLLCKKNINQLKTIKLILYIYIYIYIDLIMILITNLFNVDRLMSLCYKLLRNKNTRILLYIYILHMNVYKTSVFTRLSFSRFISLTIEA